MDNGKPVSEADFKRLEEAVDAVVLSPSKADAEQPLKRLEGLCRSLEADMTPYQREKLNDVISCAQEASGSPRNTDHWTRILQQSLGKFRMAAVSNGK